MGMCYLHILRGSVFVSSSTWSLKFPLSSRRVLVEASTSGDLCQSSLTEHRAVSNDEVTWQVDWHKCQIDWEEL